MAILKIQMPSASTVNINGNTATLNFNPDFGSERTAMFDKTQSMIDSEVLRLNAPYVPLQYGTYMKSGSFGTVIGDGEVQYTVPYAAKLYYNPQYNFNEAPMRGAYHFERMKADHKDDILQMAKKECGAK